MIIRWGQMVARNSSGEVASDRQRGVITGQSRQTDPPHVLAISIPYPLLAFFGVQASLVDRCPHRLALIVVVTVLGMLDVGAGIG